MNHILSEIQNISHWKLFRLHNSLCFGCTFRSGKFENYAEACVGVWYLSYLSIFFEKITIKHHCLFFQMLGIGTMWSTLLYTAFNDYSVKNYHFIKQLKVAHVINHFWHDNIYLKGIYKKLSLFKKRINEFNSNCIHISSWIIYQD